MAITKVHITILMSRLSEWRIYKEIQNGHIMTLKNLEDLLTTLSQKF